MKIARGAVATMEFFLDLIPVVITDFTEVDAEIVSITVREDSKNPSQNPQPEHTFELDRETGLYGLTFYGLFAIGEQHSFSAEDELG